MLIFQQLLLELNFAISNLLPNDFNKRSLDYNSILDRELRRFVITLKKLLIKKGFDEMVTVEKETEV